MDFVPICHEWRSSGHQRASGRRSCVWKRKAPTPNLWTEPPAPPPAEATGKPKSRALLRRRRLPPPQRHTGRRRGERECPTEPHWELSSYSTDRKYSPTDRYFTTVYSNIPKRKLYEAYEYTVGGNPTFRAVSVSPWRPVLEAEGSEDLDWHNVYRRNKSHEGIGEEEE